MGRKHHLSRQQYIETFFLQFSFVDYIDQKIAYQKMTRLRMQVDAVVSCIKKAGDTRPVF